MILFRVADKFTLLLEKRPQGWLPTELTHLGEPGARPEGESSILIRNE
jgi:hypothetical protein